MVVGLSATPDAAAEAAARRPDDEAR